jgi:hypothetical protein
MYSSIRELVFNQSIRKYSHPPISNKSDARERMLDADGVTSLLRLATHLFFTLKMLISDVLSPDIRDIVEIEHYQLRAFIFRLALVGMEDGESSAGRDVLGMQRLAHNVDKRLAAREANGQTVAIVPAFGRGLLRSVLRAVADKRRIINHAYNSDEKQG